MINVRDTTDYKTLKRMCLRLLDQKRHLQDELDAAAKEKVDLINSKLELVHRASVFVQCSHDLLDHVVGGEEEIGKKSMRYHSAKRLLEEVMKNG
jgi:hypothetical protein